MSQFQTAERQVSAGPKWAAASGVPPRPGHPDIRPRVSASEAAPMTSRPEQWGKCSQNFLHFSMPLIEKNMISPSNKHFSTKFI